MVEVGVPVGLGKVGVAVEVSGIDVSAAPIVAVAPGVTVKTLIRWAASARQPINKSAARVKITPAARLALAYCKQRFIREGMIALNGAVVQLRNIYLLRNKRCKTPMVCQWTTVPVLSVTTINQSRIGDKGPVRWPMCTP